MNFINSEEKLFLMGYNQNHIQKILEQIEARQKLIETLKEKTKKLKEASLSQH